MKGNKGECLFFDENRDMVYKSKFDTKENCQLRIAALLRIEVLNPDNKPYKCKRCKMWHIGKPEQIKKYSI